MRGQVVDDQLKRELMFFIKRYRLEHQMDHVERMLEVSLQIKEAISLGEDEKFLSLLDEFSSNYCLSDHEMLLEFQKLVSF